MCRGVRKNPVDPYSPRTFQNFMFQNKPSQPEPYHFFFFSTVVIGENSKGLRKPFKVEITDQHFSLLLKTI